MAPWSPCLCGTATVDRMSVALYRLSAPRLQGGRRHRLFAVYRRWHCVRRVDVSHGQVLGDSPDDATQWCCYLHCQDYHDIVLFMVVAGHNQAVSLKCDQLSFLPSFKICVARWPSWYAVFPAILRMGSPVKIIVDLDIWLF